MTYNLTQLGETSSISGMVSWANSQVNFMLVGSMILAIFIILIFMFTRRLNFIDSIVVSAFISLVISSLGVYAGLVSFMYPLAFLIMTAFGVLYLYFSKST